LDLDDLALRWSPFDTRGDGRVGPRRHSGAAPRGTRGPVGRAGPARNARGAFEGLHRATSSLIAAPGGRRSSMASRSSPDQNPFFFAAARVIAGRLALVGGFAAQLRVGKGRAWAFSGDSGRVVGPDRLARLMLPRARRGLGEVEGAGVGGGGGGGGGRPARIRVKANLRGAFRPRAIAAAQSTRRPCFEHGLLLWRAHRRGCVERLDPRTCRRPAGTRPQRGSSTPSRSPAHVAAASRSGRSPTPEASANEWHVGVVGHPGGK